MKIIAQKETIPHKGQSLTIQPGRGGQRADGVPGIDGTFIFRLADGKEVMRFEADGTVTVRGTVVDNDRKVYEWFREWMSCAEIERNGA